MGVKRYAHRKDSTFCQSQEESSGQQPRVIVYETLKRRRDTPTAHQGRQKLVGAAVRNQKRAKAE